MKTFEFKEPCAHGLYDPHKDTRQLAGRNMLIIECDGGRVRRLVEISGEQIVREFGQHRRVFIEEEQ